MRFILLIIILLASMQFYSAMHPAAFNDSLEFKKDKEDETSGRLNHYANDAKDFIRKHKGYNDKFCFLIDMRIASGENRFFIYDLRKNEIMDKGLVAHGSGLVRTTEIKFSNVAGSNCSSIGKYRIGNSYQGKFGLAYKLYGLDSTNDNAYNRFVVLHSHSCVPEVEVKDGRICESWGCPTVAPGFLNHLQEKIDGSKKSVLMWIYY